MKKMIIKKIALLILNIILILGFFSISLAIDEANNNLNTNLNQNTDINSNNTNESNEDNLNNIGNPDITNKTPIEENSNLDIKNTNQVEDNLQQVDSYTDHVSHVSSSLSQEELKSNNANLSYLKLDIDGIYPDFDKTITEYYLAIGLDIANLNIEAQTEDINATMTINGNSSLKEGENKIQIIVEAEDSTTKTYTIYVTKTDNPENFKASLKSLTIEGYNLSPSFKPYIYNYNLIVDDKVSTLEILAEPENEKATVEIIGNENLDYGNNSIRIIVNLKNEETKREYKINVYKTSGVKGAQEVNLKEPIILITFLILSIIIISILLLKRKKR